MLWVAGVTVGGFLLKICMHPSDTQCCTSICLLFCDSGELLWICLGMQGSIQQQADGDPSQSLCLTGGFAPTVSSVSTNTLG